MSEHKEHHRKHRATGGENESEMDLKTKSEARTNAKNIDDEAEERKRGGHVREERKRGGHVEHHHREHKGKDGFGPEHEPTSHHHRRKRKGGGGVESKPYDPKVEGKKKQDGEGFGDQNGPPTKRKRGGHVKKHEEHSMHGEHAKHHAGRKPRKRGGTVSSDSHPFTSAAKGHAPTGRRLDMEMDGDTE